MNLPTSLSFSTIIDAFKEHPAQLRNAVYELARAKLQREALLMDPPMSMLDLRRHMLELEIVIARIEFKLSERGDEIIFVPEARQPSAMPEHAHSHSRDVEVIPDVIRSDPKDWEFHEYANEQPPKRRQKGHGYGRIALQACAAAVFVGGLSLILHGNGGSPTVSALRSPELVMGPVADATNAPPPSARLARTSSLPLPSAYGVYALSDGNLTELDVLPGRVPDQRVFLSAVISKVSHTVLPNGQAHFIVFRRDLATSAPDRVAVRVVAKITRAMTFDPTGKARVSEVNDAWTVRGIAYDFRVSPVADNAEMLLLRPENASFVLSPGRYALVLKGQAYDFTITGTVTDPAHCLERTVAANGTFYSECKT